MKQLRRYGTAIFRRLISRRLAFRGKPAAQDGRVTLLTVDYHVTEDAIRLIRSFRKFVDPNGAVVVVQNGVASANRALRKEGAKVVGLHCNLGHGLGLDWGMRQVQTQYTLICDPDTAIISPRFREEVLDRVAKYGVAATDNGSSIYHPICLCFETRLWKTIPFSFEQQWYRPPGWDVAGALTYEVLGGLREDALVPRTRSAGPPLPSSRSGTVHYYGDVFGDVFSNTFCMSRKVLEPSRLDFDGWSRRDLDLYHETWRGWVSAVIEGSATVDDFPKQADRALNKDVVRMI
jgi:hypothetical protein